MSLEWLAPVRLLLLVLLPLAYWLAAGRSPLSGRRFRASAILRLLILASLVMALAQPRALRPAGTRAVGRSRPPFANPGPWSARRRAG